MDSPLIQLIDLTKVYPSGEKEVVGLAGISLGIHRGDFVAVMGPSGSGKSTLLHLIAGLDRPTSGRCLVDGMEPATLSETRSARWRQSHIGFVFQTFNLIPVLTAHENVELPLLLTSLSRGERKTHATAALELVGLADRQCHWPRQLSGGQEQRVAMARAIVMDPMVILADEPTGNLDAQSATEVLALLQTLNQQAGKTVILVTHDPKAAGFARRTIHLEKGALHEP
jgi:putative ABC transport system ATP-binding protein